MTRLQKKCFVLSVGMHGLLLGILVGTSAFRDKPSTKDIPILMTMIPANILDKAGVGGGSPQPAAPASQPSQPAPPALQTPPPARPAPAAVPRPQPVERQKPVEAVEPVERPKPKEVTEEPTEPALTSKKVAAKPHEIHPDFTPASSVISKKKPKTPAPEVSDAASDTYAERAAATSRLRSTIREAMSGLATGVAHSGAAGTVVDMPGQGGGEAFVGYETVIYNAYYHAWTPPDSIADKLAGADVKIVVARDGTILSADIVSKSGKPALDRSVDRALRVVTKLPPFPASAHDEQRTFLIRFNLESKEASG
jgi:TonB family protein